AAQARSTLQARLGLVSRQVVWRHLLAVVDRPDDDRLVGIALEEGNHHLLADAGNGDHAPVLSGPRRGHAQPARAVLVPLPLTVPEELHLHAAVLVDVDLLAPRPDDHRRLHAVHDRTRCMARRAEEDGRIDAFEVVLVGDFAVLALAVALAGMVADAGQDVRAVEGRGDAFTDRLDGELVP